MILYNFKTPNRDATCLRIGCGLSQLDGEGMRQMQIQQEQASKEAFKESLLKQIAVKTGSNLSDLMATSNAETQTERVAQMLHTGVNTEEQQRATSSTNTEEQQRATSSTNTEEQQRATSSTNTDNTQYYDISDAMVDITSATADYEARLERQRQIAEYELHQQETRHQEQLELARQQTQALLQEQEQAHRGEAHALLQEQEQAHRREATSVFNQVKQETERVRSKEFQERQNMENQDKRVSARIQAGKNTRRNLEHAFDSPDRPKTKAKAGPSEIASGSGDKPKFKNPESEHEPKGPRGRPRKNLCRSEMKHNQKL